ncbi:MAG: hypothetical protein ACI8PQ_003463 [Planctomycetota bacterium]|jgi:hypothetical protein
MPYVSDIVVNKPAQHRRLRWIVGSPGNSLQATRRALSIKLRGRDAFASYGRRGDSIYPID